MKPYRMIEHTADIAVHAFGATLEELFAGSAAAMAEYIFGPEIFSAAESGREEIIVAAPDSESLLVDWLSQILFLSSTKHRAYVGFDLKIEAGKELHASAGYVPAEAVEDIKAVTYHGLKIERTGAGFEARITFDI